MGEPLAHRFNANLIGRCACASKTSTWWDDLQRQKHIAEQANIAKSRFLAAASHDLRQPVQALVDVRRRAARRSMDDAARPRVHHLDGSVEALDSLFVALLDISRLDAGIVESTFSPSRSSRCSTGCAQTTPPRRRAKACGCAAPLQGHRGQRSGVCGRIARIAANAVRYTDRCVVVGCRRKPLSIEVWDTVAALPANSRRGCLRSSFRSAIGDADRARGLGLRFGDRQRAAEQRGQPLDDRQAEAEPARAVAFRVADLIELLEHPRLLFGWQCRPVSQTSTLSSLPRRQPTTTRPRSV